MTGPAPIPPLEWDEAKRQRTLAERGVDFAAFGVFWDGCPFIERQDPRHAAEPRFLRFARLDGGRVAMAVWTPRGDAVRLISVRKANRREERGYGAQLPPVWRVSERHPGGSMAFDWTKFDATTDEDIARQIAEDPDTAPELTDEMMRTAWLVVDGVRRPLVLPPAEDEPPADHRTAGEG